MRRIDRSVWVLALTLAGCGGEGGSSKSSESARDPDPVAKPGEVGEAEQGLANIVDAWPQAQGVPLEEGMSSVYVSRTQLRFGETRVATLEAGGLSDNDTRNHLIPALYDVLADVVDASKRQAELGGQEWDERLIIAADAQTPFATVFEIMFTGGRAGFVGYGFLVEPEASRQAYIPVDPPSYSASTGAGSGRYKLEGPRHALADIARNHDPDMLAAIEEAPAAGTAVLSIELGTDRMTLSRGAGNEPVAHPPGANEAIAAAAEAVRRDDPEARDVVISVDGDVPLQDVVAALAAARGPACTQTGASCVLPKVIITGGGAHGYRVMDPNLPVGGDDSDVWGGLAAGEVTGTIGLGNTSLIGKGTADGSGGFERPPRPVGQVRQKKATVVGALDRDIIRRIVRAHINEVRSCYNAGLIKKPDLAGRVVIEFVIASNGKVGAAEIGESTLADAAVEGCIAKAFERWTFPRPRDGGEVEVSYPFALSPD